MGEVVKIKPYKFGRLKIIHLYLPSNYNQETIYMKKKLYAPALLLNPVMDGIIPLLMVNCPYGTIGTFH